MAIFKLKEVQGKVGDETMYWYAGIDVDPAEYETFVDEIVSESTITRHDVKACVSALEEFICNALKDGYTIRFGDLGSFRVTVTGTGEETADEVTADNITGVRVQFTAGSLLKNYLLTSGKAGVVSLSVAEKL